jgi:hypothetical protein
VAQKDLVDLRLGVGVNISLKYGDLQPSDEDRETRRLHAETCSQLKEEIEIEILAKVGEALGYDNDTLKEKFIAREVKLSNLRVQEEAGRKLREDQRAGRG